MPREQGTSLRLGGGSRRRNRCSSSRTELRSALGEELRPSFAARCSRRFSGLPLLATLLHDALSTRGGRHPKQDRCGQCQSNYFLHRNLPPGAGFPMIPRSRAKRQAATADLLVRLAAAFLGLLSCLPSDQGQATSPNQTVSPHNSAPQSDNRSSGRRWRDTREGSVDGSFASAT